MEFSLDVRWQDRGSDANGSLVEGDPVGVGAGLADALLAELRRLGSTFVSGSAVEAVEEQFYRSIGFTQNEGHLVYIVDERPYVQQRPSRGETD